jgi:hypothetical protein
MAGGEDRAERDAPSEIPSATARSLSAASRDQDVALALADDVVGEADVTVAGIAGHDI